MRGWFVVLAAFLSQVVGLGIIMSVMQDYYEQHVYGQETSAIIKLSLVGTLGNFALNVFSPFVQILVSLIGIKQCVILATILSVVGLELSSLTTTMWQLQLTQGILFGSGGSIIFYIGMSCVQQWFSHKKGGVALGIATSGSCVGSLIMPLIITPINRRFGVSTCFRVLGGITGLFYLISGFLFKDKITNKPRYKEIIASPFGIIQFDVLKDVNFILWCLADILIELSYYTPFFFLPSYATSLGLKDTKGSSLISITASCNAVGRIFAGIIADYIGHINTVIITGFLAGCSAFLIWTFAYSFISLVFFASIFGFFGGAFVTLGPSTTAIITGMDKFESGYSMFLLVTVVAMFGPNLAGVLEAYFTTKHHQEPYLTYKLFTGSGYILGVLILIGLKWRINHGRLLSKL
ncbi:major facilitator superfamily domain-containing protein [Parasitella parasitica]|nr:major facilitator superfamily domain-containing protein [Parasitella parasitica]